MIDIIIPSLLDSRDDYSYLDLSLKTLEMFTDVPYEVILVRSDKSASANRNRGLAQASSPYVCFLDDDAWVTPNWASRLLGTFKQVNNIGMVGPKILLENGRIFCFGLNLDKRGEIIPNAHGKKNTETFSTIIEPYALPTTCLLVLREAALDIGGFNEDFKTSQWEDIDFYLRLKRAGYRGLLNGSVSVYHAHMFRTSHFQVNKKLLNVIWKNH